MLTLALDTATKVCSVALAEGQEILAEYSVTMGFTHSESLLPQIDQLFQRTGVEKRDVQKIAVSIGPGSFTGLRIGLAAAKAMTYAWQCQIAGVSTLMALAYNLPVAGLYLVPVLDAQKGNYYRGIYRWQQGRLLTEAPIAIVKGTDLLQEASALPAPAVLLGECVRLGAGTLPPALTLAAEQLRLPRAGSVALAAADPECVIGTDMETLTPYYLRRSEAEVLWQKKHPQSRSLT